MSTGASNGKEPEKEPTKKRPFIAILPILLIVGAVILSMLSLFSARFGPHEQDDFYIKRRGGFEWVIRQGDRAFESYRYNIALVYYQLAKSELDDVIKFEAESPLSDKAMLQHYYNVDELLKARTELVLIALEVSRLP